MLACFSFIKTGEFMKLKKSYVLITSAFIFSTNASTALVIKCDKVGDYLTKSEAEKCVADKIIGDRENAFKFVEEHNNKKHFGSRKNYKECTSYYWDASFFPEKYFEGQIGIATSVECNMQGSWQCTVGTVEGCFADPSDNNGKNKFKGKTTQKALIIISNSTGEVSTIYPADPE